MRVISKSSVLAIALLAIFAGRARAQDVISVNVPFPFVVGHEAFPAGHYDIEAADPSGSVLLIRGTDNKSAGFVITTRADGGDPAGETPALIFTNYEKTLKLAVVWESGDEGRNVPPATKQ